MKCLLVFCVLLSSLYKNSLFSPTIICFTWNFKDNVYLKQNIFWKFDIFTQVKYRHGFEVVDFLPRINFFNWIFFNSCRKKWEIIFFEKQVSFNFKLVSTEEELIFLQWSIAKRLFFFSGHLALKLQNNFSSKLKKIAVMSHAISAAFISSFQEVFACKELSHVKVSNLYKWWNCMVQIILFF